MHHKESRATLGGKLSAVLVAAGSSVGLGNIWRFPYVAGDNGGGAFLIIYILCVLLLGLPLMIAEFTVGRASHRNAVGAYRALNPRWSFLGYNGVLAAFLILGFYFVVSGWTAEYMVHSVTGSIARFSTAEQYKSLFENFISNPWRPVVYTCLFVLATHFVIAMGVQKGIERSAKILMPLLFLILIVLSVHSLLMPGGEAGLKFLFAPDFSKVTPTTVLVALGQAFFSLSIGIGTMVTYASYFKPDTNLRHTALNVTILDTLVAILAGVVIFPAVFSVGIEPSSGPSLVFITLPSIFNGMPLSMVWSSIFFLLLVVAALTSTISLHEVVTVYLHEEWHLSRKAAAWLTTAATAALASLASLSLGALGSWKIAGLSLFDSLDFLTANILLPAGGLFTCIFVGWKLDHHILKAQITNDGELKFRIYGLFSFLLRYVCPAVLLLIYIAIFLLLALLPYMIVYTLVLLLFVLVAAATIYGIRRGKTLWGLDLILFFCAGIAGCILAFLALFSQHPAVSPNYLLFVFHPLHLFCLPWMINKVRKRQKSWYMRTNCAVLTLFILLWAIIPQRIDLAVLPLALCLLVRSASNLILTLKKR